MYKIALMGLRPPMICLFGRFIYTSISHMKGLMEPFLRMVLSVVCSFNRTVYKIKKLLRKALFIFDNASSHSDKEQLRDKGITVSSF